MSLVPGFEYDIFISYRHNDNRSGWVTKFINSLKEELAATIKEPLSIYFDQNPHDGLLETHNVDKSLEGKLKCLIFIPIISQTYCDPKSFAWQHELCSFNEMSKKDQFGRDIKLGNGNVASRIFPIQIHELDVEDKATFESETGGSLRAIEFIFKSPGVNRPLNLSDKREENSNKTFYRDQVNKVANAIKDIISGLKNFEAGEKKGGTSKQSSSPQQTFNRSNSKRKPIIVGVLVLVALVALYFFYRFNKPHGEVDETDRSVAVLAFSDLSPNNDQEWYSDGLTEEILNSLANLHELKVTARTSSFYFKEKDVPIQEIAEKLGVAHVVEGSVQRIGKQLRITAQLIRAKDEFHIWSKRYDRPADDLFAVQTDIAENIAKELLRELTPEKQAKLVNSKPTNIEAYEYYLRGYKAYFKKFRTTWTIPDFEETERYFLKAISLEPTYADAYVYLADLYDSRAAMISTDRTKFRHLGDSAMRIGFKLNPNSILTLLGHAGSFQNNIDSTFFYLKKAYRVSPDAPETITAIAGFYLGIGLNDPALKFAHRLVELDPLSEIGIIAIGGIQLRHGAYEEATKSFMKVIELNHDNANAHFLLGQIFIMQGNRENALHHFKIVKQINPEGRQATVLQAMLLAQEGRKAEALQLVKNDLRILSLLGMKKEFLTSADSLSKTTGNEVHISAVLDPNGLLKNPVFDFVRDEGGFLIIFDRIKKDYKERMAKYGELE